MKNEKLKNDVSKHVAQLIKEARKAKGWTKYRLAAETNLPCGHMHRIETGRYAIRIDVLQRVCAALKLEIKFPLAI